VTASLDYPKIPDSAVFSASFNLNSWITIETSLAQSQRNCQLQVGPREVCAAVTSSHGILVESRVAQVDASARKHVPRMISKCIGMRESYEFATNSNEKVFVV
jgi:hypothetical protein